MPGAIPIEDRDEDETRRDQANLSSGEATSETAYSKEVGTERDHDGRPLARSPIGRGIVRPSPSSSAWPSSVTPPDTFRRGVGYSGFFVGDPAGASL